VSAPATDLRQRGVMPSVGVPELDRRRRAVLEQRAWFPPPPVVPLAARRNDLRAAGETLAAQVERHGLGVADFDRPLDPASLLRLSWVFGEPVEEDAPDVQPFVVDRAVLRLDASVRDPSVALQPFSSSWITLHSEGSRRPAGQRPTFLLFQCLVPPRPGDGGQTLLRDARDVVRGLGDSSVDVLARTALAGGRSGTPVLTSADSGPVLTFRDPAPDPVRWESDADPDRVQPALLDLLTAVYDAARVRGVHWRRNRLVVLSNTRFLHGRSVAGNGERILDRVRVR
jgi:alpha-ketoglutarate-dependent taurine dioxygenase